MSKARGLADLGSDSVLATSSTGVDVVGTVTATAFAGDGSGLTGIVSAQEVNSVWLEVAQNGSRFVAMHDGVSDSYDTADGVDVLDSIDVLFGSGLITKLAARELLSPINMTSNTVPSPYVASLSNAAATAYELFDGTVSYEQTPIGGWAKIDLGSAVTVGAYSITAGVNTTDYSWKTWTFEGSNNDFLSWTTLDTRTDFTAWPPTGTPKEFSCTSGSYRYYRWAPTAAGSANGAYAQRLQVLGALATGDYTITSEVFTADAVPTTAVIGVQATGAHTLNTDMIVSASRDDGVTWTAGVLAQVYTLAGGAKYYETADIDISGQPSGTSMRYKVYADSAFVSEVNATIFKWS